MGGQGRGRGGGREGWLLTNSLTVLFYVCVAGCRAYQVGRKDVATVFIRTYHIQPN